MNAELEALRAYADDEHAGRLIAGGAADRFRDIITEVLDLPDNPGDDELVTRLRDLHGKTGPEPTRWRDFCTGALAFVDQLHAEPREEGGDQ